MTLKYILIQPSSANTQWIAQYIPISVALCSNVQGFETPKCIINGDWEGLVREMVKYLDEIRISAAKKVKSKFSTVFQFLDLQIKQLEEQVETENSGSEDRESKIENYQCNDEAMETSEN